MILGLCSWLPSRVDFFNDNFGYTWLCCGAFPFQEMLCARAGNASGLTRQCLSFLCATVAQIMVGSSQKSNCSKSGHWWGSWSLGQLQSFHLDFSADVHHEMSKKGLKYRTEALTQLYKGSQSASPALSGLEAPCSSTFPDSFTFLHSLLSWLTLARTSLHFQFLHFRPKPQPEL